ncbi:CBS domain-containing protein [Methanomassiliicoccus luminyensis]|uniref:CBS domain-containing protein n=1 Tax=Methanomassiliicoccus luminyensis TaxID=1080712 RepID=UPI00138B1156|nr:CBS domain-containing protein [Methanomassiliicoccus luminyensis]
MKAVRFPEATQIRQMRHSLGITQSALAKRSGVSQSTIAKIERCKIKGSYPEVVKLFEALEDEAETRLTKVRLRDISTKQVIGLQAEDPVRRASELMREHDISQMPVFEGDRVVGSLCDKTILELVMAGMKIEEVARRPIRSVMDGPFPVVDEDVEKESVESLILAEHAVLTTRNGKITGIVTGADLIQIDWSI